MLDTVFEWFSSILDFLAEMVDAVFLFFKDMLFWCLDQLFGFAISLLDLAGDGLGGLNPLSYIDAIPDSTKYIMQLVGFNECMSMIVTALIIRFVLQLIPFVRWGS